MYCIVLKRGSFWDIPKVVTDAAEDQIAKISCVCLVLQQNDN